MLRKFLGLFQSPQTHKAAEIDKEINDTIERIARHISKSGNHSEHLKKRTEVLMREIKSAATA